MDMDVDRLKTEVTDTGQDSFQTLKSEGEIGSLLSPDDAPVNE